MAPAKILVVDDDPAIRTLIHRYLSQQNYQVESAGDGQTALFSFAKLLPDLAILDVNLPDTTGFQLCQQMQSQKDVFVLMLTSLNDEENIVRGFEQGADDYITKPFGLVELGARVRAILKRQRVANQPEPDNLVFGSLVINPVRRDVHVKGDLITLTTLEFDLLYCLASQPGKAWKRQDLIQEVWNYEYVGELRVVDVHVGQIRKKIEIDPENTWSIKTLRGVGYKFEL
ncbi:MAG: response regulator transcription factor [Microcoleaceae cyanobacterium]